MSGADPTPAQKARCSHAAEDATFLPTGAAGDLFSGDVVVEVRVQRLHMQVTLQRPAPSVYGSNINLRLQLNKPCIVTFNFGMGQQLAVHVNTKEFGPPLH